MKPIRRILQILPIIALLLIASSIVIVWLAKVDWHIDAPGEVRAERFEVVRPSIDGTLRDVMVHAGETVTAGQVLLEIDDRDLVDEITSLSSQVSEIRASLAGTRRSRDILAGSIQPLESIKQKSDLERRAIQARRQVARTEELRVSQEVATEHYRRVQTLQGEGLASKETLEQARLEMIQSQWRLRQSELEADEHHVELRLGQSEQDLMKAQQLRSLSELETLIWELEQQEARLSYNLAEVRKKQASRLLRASMDGVVISPPRAKLLGQRITVGDEILTVVDPASISFVAMVPEEAVVKVRPGQAALVEINAFPKRKFPIFRGTVIEVGPEPEASDANIVLYPVQVQLSKPWVEQDGQQIYFRSGMQGSAQIVYESEAKLIRSFIDFLTGT